MVEWVAVEPDVHGHESQHAGYGHYGDHAGRDYKWEKCVCRLSTGGVQAGGERGHSICTTVPCPTRLRT